MNVSLNDLSPGDFSSFPEKITLTDKEIHLCLIHLSDLTVLDERVLSPGEKERAAKFKFEQDRQRFVASHVGLRQLLARYLNQAPEAIEFSYGAYKKPAVEGLEFNLSHTQDLALIAISRQQALGVDIERIRPDIVTDGLAALSFSKAEFSAFTTLPQDQKMAAFFNAWTRKEAVIKAIGEGVYFGLKRFSVSLVPGEPASLLDIEGDLASTWQLISFMPQAGYQSALAWRGPPMVLKTWAFSVTS